MTIIETIKPPLVTKNMSQAEWNEGHLKVLINCQFEKAVISHLGGIASEGQRQRLLKTTLFTYAKTGRSGDIDQLLNKYGRNVGNLISVVRGSAEGNFTFAIQRYSDLKNPRDVFQLYNGVMEHLIKYKQFKCVNNVLKSHILSTEEMCKLYKRAMWSITDQKDFNAIHSSFNLTTYRIRKLYDDKEYFSQGPERITEVIEHAFKKPLYTDTQILHFIGTLVTEDKPEGLLDAVEMFFGHPWIRNSLMTQMVVNRKISLYKALAKKDKYFEVNMQYYTYRLVIDGYDNGDGDFCEELEKQTVLESKKLDLLKYMINQLLKKRDIIGLTNLTSKLSRDSSSLHEEALEYVKSLNRSHR
jgi:hypothetical protein